MGEKSKIRGKGNILLVERDTALREFVSRTLIREGYRVFGCEDGYGAFLLSESLSLPLHLLLAEVVVGIDISGVELSRHLQVLRPGLRVLYLSTVPADPALRMELQSALDSYLSKPFSGPDLLSKVERLLAKDISPGKAAGGKMEGRRQSSASPMKQAIRFPFSSQYLDWLSRIPSV
ncbi:MAG: response regulator [Fibrobacterota bacterium]|nr:response regulator [Fibrobacterota bacterium]